MLQSIAVEVLLDTQAAAYLRLEGGREISPRQRLGQFQGQRIAEANPITGASILWVEYQAGALSADSEAFVGSGTCLQAVRYDKQMIRKDSRSGLWIVPGIV